jgi:hypothetical protein
MNCIYLKYRGEQKYINEYNSVIKPIVMKYKNSPRKGKSYGLRILKKKIKELNEFHGKKVYTTCISHILKNID